MLQGLGDLQTRAWASNIDAAAALLQSGRDDLSAIRILAHDDPKIMSTPDLNARSLAMLRARHLNVFQPVRSDALQRGSRPHKTFAPTPSGYAIPPRVSGMRGGSHVRSRTHRNVALA
jgi:hypothetical protein